MSDVFSMRLARAADRRANAAATDFHAEFDEVKELLLRLSASDSIRGIARTYLNSVGYPIAAERTSAFDSVNLFLAEVDNRPSLAALIALLAAGQSTGSAQTLRTWLDSNKKAAGILAAASLATLLTEAQPGLRTSISRALSIYGLVDHISSNLPLYQAAPGVPAPDPAPQLIFDCLRWRRVVFPSQLLDVAKRLNPPSNAVVRQGIADLFVMSSEWKKYAPGEIAYIENVLPGEARLRELTNVDERETSSTVDTTTTTFSEQDNQSTDRFEMNSESAQDLQLTVKAEAQVDTSGQYGPTKVDSHLGGSLEYSQHDTTKRAVSQSRETISRAITRVEQTVRTIRTQRALTRTTELNSHKLSNSTTRPFSGIYRWVDKIIKFTLKKYPNRYLLEFQIPEPASWIRWLYEQNDKPSGISAENPVSFTIDGKEESTRLTADHVSEKATIGGAANPLFYTNIGARYYASSLVPPPDKILVNELFIKETENPWNDKEPTFDPIKFVKLGDITVPAGYVATRWWITLGGWGEPKIPHVQDAKFYTRVYLGQQYENVSAPDLIYEPSREGPVADAIDAWPLGPFIVTSAAMGEGIGLPKADAKLPVSIDLHSVRGVSVRIIVECTPSAQRLQEWRIATYETLASAYFSMKDRYDSEVAASDIRRGTVISGNSPSRNEQVIREELKKHIISLLFSHPVLLPAVPFSWNRAIDIDEKTGEPSMNSSRALEHAPAVLFIEQAFEWEKLTYVPYPYIWADHKSQWSKLADIQSADPVFATFLRAGSARTVVSVRPGFESTVQLFLQFGVVWNGGNAPAPGDIDYLSIADELRALERAPDSGLEVESWESTLPTSLVWLQGAEALPSKTDSTGQAPGSSDPSPAKQGWLCKLLLGLCNRNL